MTPLPRFVLYWSAVPAISLSIWLLHIAQVPRSTLMLQVVAAAFASLVFVVLVSSRRIKLPDNTEWVLLLLLLSLFVPLLATTPSGPERWLVLGGVRLYVAPVVLPVALFLLGAPLIRTPWLYAAAVIAGAVALVLQPDASQVSAFALGMLALVVSRSHFRLRLALLAVLLVCTAFAWQIPDPLMPVRHVEGVFSLAAEISPFALVAALVSAALPVLALLWAAWLTRSSGTFAVAVYYAALFAQAPLQVTPVPLLGFGAGPILGYFLVAEIISRASNAVPDNGAAGAGHAM
jgi:hypothetical protein